MKTAKLLLGAILCIAFYSETTVGQTVTRRGVAPVYIPGDDTYDSIVKQATPFSPVSAVKTVGKSSTPTGSNSGNSYGDGNGDCGCSTGCGDGCGCGSGCGTGCGGGCDQVGNSFFGRIRDLSPIKFSLANSGESCGCGSGGDCSCQCDDRTGLARLLPRINITSNACNKYVSVFAGYSNLEDFDSDQFGSGTGLISFNDGWNIGFTRGRRFPNNWRLEAEFRAQHNTADTFQTGDFVGMEFVPTAEFDATDSIYSLTSMRNLIHDFDYFCSRTVPYLGVGVGGLYANGDVVVPALGEAVGINDWAFAYQLIAGLSRKINCSTEAYTEYRYFGTNGLAVNDANTQGFIDEFDYQTNNVVFGVRYTIPNSRGK